MNILSPLATPYDRVSTSINVDGKDHSSSSDGRVAVPGLPRATGHSRSSLMSDYFSPAQNSVLPSKPYLQSARRTPSGKERPKSTISESSSTRSTAPLSARQPPRGASAGTVKRWSSMSNSIEGNLPHMPIWVLPFQQEIKIRCHKY